MDRPCKLALVPRCRTNSTTWRTSTPLSRAWEVEGATSRGGPGPYHLCDHSANLPDTGQRGPPAMNPFRLTLPSWRRKTPSYFVRLVIFEPYAPVPLDQGVENPPKQAITFTGHHAVAIYCDANAPDGEATGGGWIGGQPSGSSAGPPPPRVTICPAGHTPSSRFDAQRSPPVVVWWAGQSRFQ